ncbi:MAG TPA: flagellar hook capping FlgD N-terminal domain-containing protein [Frateuria sp.]|uniref:flagellar hook assembly protein FlgD n=1 Tax=Frateuria sp. TaxID=2211372 RepID=UPI002D809952|nr:flagellar hook capping FlgD N-terminal domain-containing protein [Frateuria sp.]HET6804171.1 flagellar hook capping FlgD N-terminal domain-containing protein [Frateuria sp.]
MSDIAVNSNTAASAAGSALGQTKTLSQADFLSLLIQQMRNQDPTLPMDSSQMVSQLAQINQVSATQNLQTSFDALAQSMQGNQLLQASSMVGRDVTVPSAVGRLQGGSLDGAVNVPDGGGHTLVQIQDGAGNVVRTIDLGTQTAGLADFHWDGTGDDGQPLPPGTYGLAAQTGSTAVATYVSGKVAGVGMTGADGAYLDVDGFGGVLLSQVARVN